MATVTMTSCSSVDCSSLVFQPVESFNRQLVRVPCYQRCAIQPLVIGSLSIEFQILSDGLQILRNHSVHQSILQKLPTLSCVSGTQVHNGYTIITFRNAPTYDRRDKLIHCLLLTTAKDILRFLHTLYRSARSALLTVAYSQIKVTSHAFGLDRCPCHPTVNTKLHLHFSITGICDSLYSDHIMKFIITPYF